MARSIAFLILALQSWALNAATDIRTIREADKDQMQIHSVHFSNIHRESRGGSVYLTYTTTPGSWSQTIRCPRGSLKSLQLQGDIYVIDHDGAYNYRKGSGWNDRSNKLYLGNLLPDFWLYIGTPANQPAASATIQCASGNYAVYDTIFTPIERLSNDKNVDVPRCDISTHDGNEYCTFLTYELAKSILPKSRNTSVLNTWQQQVDAAQAFNKAVQQNAVQQDQRRKQQAVTQAQVATRSSLLKAVLVIAGVIGVLLVIGYMQRIARRQM